METEDMEVKFYLMDLESKFKKIKPHTYYLSYSGGKDSHFLYWFIKEYLKRDDIKIVGINTYMEHSEILDRIKKNCDIVLKPEMNPMQVKLKYGSPCFSKTQDDYIDRWQNGNRAPYLIARIEGHNLDGSKTQFGLSKKARKLLMEGKLHKISNKCCKYLKKETAKKFQEESGLKPILGVRGSESLARKGVYKSCFQKDGRFTPIWDLSDELLDKIIKEYNIEVPEVYKHVCRTGCMGCPYGSWKHDTEKELMIIDDRQFNFVTMLFKESYEVLGIDVEKIREERNLHKK